MKSFNDDTKPSIVVLCCVIINMIVFMGISFSSSSNQYIRARTTHVTITNNNDDKPEINNIRIDVVSPIEFYDFTYITNYLISNSSNIPIKKEMNDESPVLGHLKSGELVIVEGFDSHNSNGWTQILYNNQIAYVKTCYLSSKMNFTPVNQKAFITKDNVPIYKTPMEEKEYVVGTGYLNNETFVTAINDVWTQIQVNGDVYYTLTDYLSYEMPFVNKQVYLYVYPNTCVYSKPDINSPVCCVLNQNDMVYGIRENDTWVEISSKDAVYYILKKDTSETYL